MTRQTDGKSLYEQQEERILAQSDAFISLLTKRGILGDHQIDNEKVRKAKQEKNRKSYHNTQLLLQHYTRGCMHKRNRHLVDNSSACISYLTENKGGTFYTVNYAKSKGVEVINIAE